MAKDTRRIEENVSFSDFFFFFTSCLGRPSSLPDALDLNQQDQQSWRLREAESSCSSLNFVSPPPFVSLSSLFAFFLFVARFLYLLSSLLSLSPMALRRTISAGWDESESRQLEPIPAAQFICCVPVAKVCSTNV